MYRIALQRFFFSLLVVLAISGFMLPQGIVEGRPLVVGDSVFTSRTNNALNLLNEKSLSGWDVVCKYVGKIKQYHRSGMNVYAIPPTFEVGEDTFRASVTWYASAIAHDAYHSKLYFEYLEKHGSVPHEVWTGNDAEMQCLEFQIQILEEIGAPQSEIKYAKSLVGTNWWDGERNW